MSSEWKRWALNVVMQTSSLLLCSVAMVTPNWIKVLGKKEGLLPDYSANHSMPSESNVVIELTASFLNLCLGISVFLLLVYICALVYRAVKYRKTTMYPHCLDHLPSIACFFILASCSIYTSHVRSLPFSSKYSFGYSCILAWAAFGVGLVGLVVEKVARRAHDLHELKGRAIVKSSLFFLHTTSLVCNITSISSPSWVVTQNATIGLFLNCTRELTCSTDVSVKERMTSAFALIGVIIQGVAWLMWAQQKIILRLLLYTSIPTSILFLFACIVYTTLALELPNSDGRFIFGTGFILFWSAFGLYAVVAVFFQFLQQGSYSLKLVRTLICDDVLLLFLMLIPGWVFHSDQYVTLFSDPTGKEHATAALLGISLFIRTICYVVYVINERTIVILKKVLLATAGCKLTACLIFTAMTLSSASFGFLNRFAYSFIITWIVNVIDMILVMALFTTEKGNDYIKRYWMSVLFAACIIFLSCSLATNNWINTDTELIGLFSVCNATKCVPLNTDWTSYERLTALFLVPATLIYTGSCFTMCSYLFCCKPNRPWLPQLGFYLSTVASSLAFIACTIYTAQSPSNASYGSSFASAWIGFGLSFMSTLVMWTVMTRISRQLKKEELPDMGFRTKYLVSALSERPLQDNLENFSVRDAVNEKFKENGLLGNGCLVLKDDKIFVRYKHTDNALAKVVYGLEELISVETVEIIGGLEQFVNDTSWLKYCLRLKTATKTQVYFEKSRDGGYSSMTFVTISCDPLKDFEKVLTKHGPDLVVRKQISAPLPVTKHLQGSDEMEDVTIQIKDHDRAFVSGKAAALNKAVKRLQQTVTDYPLIRSFRENRPGSSYLLGRGAEESVEIAKKFNSLVAFAETGTADEIAVMICSQNPDKIDEMWDEILGLISGVYEVIPAWQSSDVPTNVPGTSSTLDEMNETRPKLPVTSSVSSSEFEDVTFNEQSAPLLKQGQQAAVTNEYSVGPQKFPEKIATKSKELRKDSSKIFYEQTSFDKDGKSP